MKKVLIVDDHTEVRRLVEMTLRVGEYKVFQAQNGQEAIEAARKKKPDLIIMDIMMPGDMDGLEATRVLKDDPETKDSTIIMLTAKGQEFDKEKGFEAGAEDYFVKPFSPLELIKKVEEVLG
jgi:two-component system phosphate regulon response regulator PhoB